MDEQAGDLSRRLILIHWPIVYVLPTVGGRTKSGRDFLSLKAACLLGQSDRDSHAAVPEVTDQMRDGVRSTYNCRRAPVTPRPTPAMGAGRGRGRRPCTVALTPSSVPLWVSGEASRCPRQPLTPRPPHARRVDKRPILGGETANTGRLTHNAPVGRPD